MQTLILNGSPRQDGATAACVRMLKARMPGECAVIEAYRAGVSPCVDCRHCWTHGACAIRDGMQEAYRMIDRADAVVIASPIYFAELTGPLLVWASRLQHLWVARNISKRPALCEKRRKGGLILVDGGDGHMETAQAMGKRLLRVMGATYDGLVYVSGTDQAGRGPLPHPERTVAEIQALAGALQSEAQRL